MEKPTENELLAGLHETAAALTRVLREPDYSRMNRVDLRAVLTGEHVLLCRAGWEAIKD